MKIIILKLMKSIIIIFINDIKKIQVDKNGNEYILLKSDIFFSEHNLVADIEKKDGDKDLNVELKKQEILEGELN